MRTVSFNFFMRRTAFAFLVFSSTAIAQTTYYVNNVSGSDSSSGLTSNTPKKTIVNAIATASTNDVISVATTGQIYNDSIIVSKPLTFTATNGKPQLIYLRMNLSSVFSSPITFSGGFFVQTLVLSAGRVQGSDSLTIISNGKVFRQSASAEVLQQLKFAGQVDLEYNGTIDITMGFEAPATDSTIKNLTLNFDPTVSTPRLTMNRSFFVYNVNFVNGFLITGPYFIQLDNPAGVPSHGYTRNVQSGNKSHVVGNVRKTLKAGTIIPFGRNEFPIGDALFYRPLVFTFLNFTSNQSLGINVIASETNQRPTGIVGLPIANGVSQGVDIARYPDFYWSIQADSTYDKEHTLELTAQDFNDYDDIAYVRIIRRPGTANDSTNRWVHSGMYDNFVLIPLTTVVNINATGGITKEGNIFTYGLKSRMTIANPIGRIDPSGLKYYKKSLTNPPLFVGNHGPLKFMVSIANPAVASVEIQNNDTLLVTFKYTGSTTITIVATDTNEDRISYICAITPPTSVKKNLEIPTHYSLSQNYPNPFNPTTTIEFALPQSQFVKLTIYNMLGEEVERLVDNALQAGSYKVTWDVKGLNSGVYFYRLQTGNFIETKKLILLK